MKQLNVVDERYHTLTDEELMKKILYIAFIIYSGSCLLFDLNLVSYNIAQVVPTPYVLVGMGVVFSGLTLSNQKNVRE